MPQTLLAILAMMIAVYMSVNMQQEVFGAQREMVANELEVMATGVALQAMETIRTRAFDQAMVDSTFSGKSSLSAAPFSTGKGCQVFGTGTDVCDDIDDFHEMKTAIMNFEMGEDDIPFKVDVEVYYVDSNLDHTNDKAYQKEVIVFIQDTLGQGQKPFITQPIHLSRVFAYDFK